MLQSCFLDFCCASELVLSLIRDPPYALPPMTLMVNEGVVSCWANCKDMINNASAIKSGRGITVINDQGGVGGYRVKKGVDLPLSGRPELVVEDAVNVRRVALLGTDYVGMKPAMAVKLGDRVKLGQILFTDKKTSGVRFTSPACGKVAAINRGEKRALLSVVIEVDGDQEESFASYDASELESLSREAVVENLLASGLWTVLRSRPYSKIPSPEKEPHSIFVNAMDTNPLAADPAIAVKGRQEDLVNGLKVISRLCIGKVYLCQPEGDALPGSELEFVQSAYFAGPHPAGLVGTHIHCLDPVSMEKSVWHLNLQDLLAIGALFTTGRINVERIISLAGSMFERPRLLRTRVGVSVNELIEGELKDASLEKVRGHSRIADGKEIRVISGSVLQGYQADGALGFLGRYHLQICAIEEDPKREFLEWHHPGIDRFSVTRLFISRLLQVKNFRFTTCTHGSSRAMVPIGTYERVMPLDVMPTFLLRALIVEDTDQAQALGCLELDEEDLALCTFACPAKYDYGPILRRNLTVIESDG